MVAPCLSLLGRTGNGLGHAFTKLELTNQGVSNIDLLKQYKHVRYVVCAEGVCKTAVY